MRVYLLAATAALLVLTLACEKEQEAPAQPFSTENVLIALDDEREGATSALLTLIDLSTGETVGELTSGYQTWAVFRPSAGELLVSDLEGPDFQGRLLVYDIADLGSPEWSIDLPDRGAAKGYGPFWGLSRDARYLYYTVHPRNDEGEPQRLANVVGIVDLEARREVVRAEMPGFCPAMMPLGESDVLALCGNGRSLVSVTPNGSVSAIAGPLPAVTPAPDPRGFWHNPVHGGLYGDGGAFIAYGNGDVVFAGSELPTTNLLPSRNLRLWGSGVWGSGEWRLDDGRVLFATGPTEPHTQTGILFETLIVFDPVDPLSPARFDLPDGITHATPLNANRVALLDTVGQTIYVLDLASGEVTGELRAPSGARWLVGP
jgi:hypothetical protein